MSPEFVEGYETLLCGLDVSGGDNPWGPDITDHNVVDAIANKEDKQLPPIAAARGYKIDDKMDLQRIHKEFDLLSLPGKLLGELDHANIDPIRKGVLEREIKLGDVQLRHMFSDVVSIPKPTFVQLWQAVRGTSYPRLSQFNGEIASIKQTLTFLLNQVGHKVSHASDLRTAIFEWRKKMKRFTEPDVEEIKFHARRSVDCFVTKFQAVCQDIPGLTRYMQKLDSSALIIKPANPKCSFSAGLSYHGGTKDGKPSLAGNFEWKCNRPATEGDIWYISAHEGVHWANAALMDLQRRDGLLGDEAALLTMGTPRAILEEGLAQTMPELLYGNILGMIEPLGIDVVIELVLDQLQDIGRLAASIGENIEFNKITDNDLRKKTIKDYVTLNLLQSDEIGEKYLKDYWRKNPVGICYSAAYYYGSRSLRDANFRYGRNRVLSVATHSEGLCDIQAFQQRVAKKTN